MTGGHCVASRVLGFIEIWGPLKILIEKSLEVLDFLGIK